MHISLILLVFGVVFIAELPDKSLFGALILGTRYRALHVWLGAAAAFLVHVIIGVSAGRLLTLLPHRLVEGIVAMLFLLGAGLIFFGKHGLEETPAQKQLNSKDSHSFRKVFFTSFSVVFIGEWGDITQIAVINYAAKYHDTFNVAFGAIAGLWAVAGLAVFVGGRVLDFVSPRLLQRVTGIILLTFGVLSAYAALR